MRLTDAPLKAHQPFLSLQELEGATDYYLETGPGQLATLPAQGAMDGGAGTGSVSFWNVPHPPCLPEVPLLNPFSQALPPSTDISPVKTGMQWECWTGVICVI